MAKDFSDAIWELTGILKKLEIEPGKNAWEKLIQCSSRKAVDHHFISMVEEEIPKYLSSLPEADKRNIWSYTFTGQMTKENETQWAMEDIEKELENELFSGILEQAFKET
jgi:hypothetical protein